MDTVRENIAKAIGDFNGRMLIGVEAQQEKLSVALDKAIFTPPASRDRPPSFILLVGFPGTGKTHALKRAIAATSAKGSYVKAAIGDPFECEADELLTELAVQLDRAGAVSLENLGDGMLDVAHSVPKERVEAHTNDESNTKMEVISAEEDTAIAPDTAVSRKSYIDEREGENDEEDEEEAEEEEEEEEEDDDDESERDEENDKKRKGHLIEHHERRREKHRGHGRGRQSSGREFAKVIYSYVLHISQKVPVLIVLERIDNFCRDAADPSSEHFERKHSIPSLIADMVAESGGRVTCVATAHKLAVTELLPDRVRSRGVKPIFFRQLTRAECVEHFFSLLRTVPTSTPHAFAREWLAGIDALAKSPEFNDFSVKSPVFALGPVAVQALIVKNTHPLTHLPAHMHTS